MRRRHLPAIVLAAVLLALGLSAQAVAFAPSAQLGVAFAPGSPAPPVLNQPYSYAIDVGNDGDVPLDDLVIIDTLPVEMSVSRVTTGSYTGLAEFAAGEGVRVSYEKNTALGVFTLWGSSPNAVTNTTLTAPPPGLGAGEYLTRVRWEYGQAAPGMRASARPAVAGQVIHPDNAGGPVVAGDPVQNCVRATASSTAGSTDVTKDACQTFDLIAGPAITIAAPDSTPLGSPVQATATLSGGDPTGTIAFQVFAASDAACTTALTTEHVEVDGTGPYPSPDFIALEAGAYKWVARYTGDDLHAASATACSDPAGEFAVVAPPMVSASFGATEIAVGDSTPLTFTITNAPANTVPLTGVALEDTLPAGLAVASPNGLSGGCGAGTITAAPGTHDVNLVDGTVAVGSSCSFSVDVTASAPGSVTHTTGAVRSANGGTGNTATASLTVHAAPEPTQGTPSVPPATRTEPTVPPSRFAPRTAQDLARACSPANLALLGVTEAGSRVRFRGVADALDAGRQVVIRALASGRVAARATVLPDGSFEATGRRPSRRVLNKTRYRAELGDRRSPSLKLTRRLRAQLTAGTETITISGRAAPPLDNPIRRVVIRRLTSCAAGYDTVARVKPSSGGRFHVSLARTTGPALFVAETQVRTKAGGSMRTFSLMLADG